MLTQDHAKYSKYLCRVKAFLSAIRLADFNMLTDKIIAFDRFDRIESEVEGNTVNKLGIFFFLYNERNKKIFFNGNKFLIAKRICFDMHYNEKVI